MKESIKYINTKALRRAKRVRRRVCGTPERPRLSVYLSNQHMFAQFIDDEQSKTLLGISDIILGDKAKRVKVERARAFGAQVAAKAKEQGIAAAVFDRGARKYHGRLRAFAEGAREAGLQL